MRATALEFRLRVVIMIVIISLGFWAPWIDALDLGRSISLLEWVALQVSRTGFLSFASATVWVIVLAAAFAAVAAILRVWGTAYLGAAVVNHVEMKAGAVMADGPYRFVRNPLYLGTWGMIAAVCFAMPPSGALFTMVLITVLLLRLILGEEAFLARQLGEPYALYKRAVPRLIPRLRGSLPPSDREPRWGHALLAETNALGLVVIFAGLSWRYDNRLMLRAILVNFGISIVLRALTVGGERHEAAPASR